MKPVTTKTPKWYWLIPVILITFQIIYTAHSFNQIRFEELGESIRMPFFMHYRFIYSGMATFLTWNSLMTLLYSLFGFHLFLGKYVKIILQLLSLLALAAVLKKFFGYKRSILPLLAIGLSPTQFYFNMLMITCGLDLVFLPISIFFLVFFSPSLGWISAMLGWLSYSTFIFYLPALALLYFKKLTRPKIRSKLFLAKNIAISLSAFLLPLFVIFLYIKNRNLLIYDPVNGNNLFRGGGVLKLDPQLFFQNLGYLMENLFIVGDGYYYELIQVEFSLFFPILTILLIFYLATKILTSKQKSLNPDKITIIVSLVVLVLNIIIVNFSDILTPGLRRYTPVLASFYTLYTLTWVYLGRQKFKPKINYLLTAIFLLIPIHHLLVFPANLDYLKQPSHYAFYQDAIAFNYPDPPEATLAKFVDKIQKDDLKLACQDKIQNTPNCRYVELYTFIASPCVWNHLNCHQIYGFDLKTDKFIPLSVDLWNNNYFGH